MRLDQALLARGLVATRAIAQRLVSEGAACVNGQVVRRAATPVTEDDTLELLHETQFVSRGGDKLEGALAAWGVPVEGKVCLDIGAGTGGFADCLLQRGAAKVYALDVGHGQLHPRLHDETRIVSREGVNCRSLTPEEVGEVADFAAVDVSFISLTLVLPSVAECVVAEGNIIALVKPQFECGPKAAEEGRGVIRDPQLHHAALDRIRKAARELSLQWRAEMPSPILGGDGNREFLVWLSKNAAQ